MTGTIPLTLERYAAQGRAIGRLGGKVVMVERGIAGESVTVEIEREEARFALARVAEVVSPSPDRVTPPCPHFTACGGCDWQHVRYLVQLDLKRQVAQEQLERIGRLTPPTWTVTAAPQPLEYRDKLECVPVATRSGWAVGLHAPDGVTVTPITRCRLAPASFTRIGTSSLEHLAGSSTAGSAPPGGIVRLTVQGGFAEDGSPTHALTLHVRKAREVEALVSRGAALLAHLNAQGLATGGIAVALGGDEDHPGTQQVIAGSGILYKQVGALRFPLPLDAFFQVHPRQAEALAGYVAGQIKAHQAAVKSKRILDLFCGAGLFSLPLLHDGFTVAGAEMSRSAIQCAQRMAAEGGFGSTEFRVADLDRPWALRHLTDAVGFPDAVIVDPPRRGLAARLVGDLLQLAPGLLVYVSCDPGTFARDAKRLVERYDLVALQGFDMFPQTHHLEIVGTFRLRKG